MVEKMCYINITGPVDDLDRVVDEYLSKFDIQLENAVSELKDVTPFNLPNPYTGELATARKLMAGMGLMPPEPDEYDDIGLTEASEIIDKANKYYEQRNEAVKALITKQDEYRDFLALISHYRNLDFEFSELKRFEFIGYRFGHMPISSFRQFEAFLYDDQDVLLVTGENDGHNMWAIYFVPEGSKDKVDSVFASLHFERVCIPFELDGEVLTGTPKEIYENTERKLEALEEDIHTRHRLELEGAGVTEEQLLAAYLKIKDICYHYDARKQAARSSKDFYVFVGWMADRDARELARRIEGDDKVVFIIEQDNDAIVSEAPTKLKNLRLFAPFEFFVRMYGLPAYGEIDPTPFVAITYTLMFGIMFGDLGQGLALSVVGWYLYLKRRLPLGSIMGIIGISSMFFGVMYGSVFGLEDVLPAVWLRPAESITSILFVTIGMGVVLILLAMVFNMLNAFHHRDWGNLFLSPNGLAGMLFYSGMVIVVYAMFTGLDIPDLLVAGLIVIPLALMALREPIMEFHDNPHQVKLSQFLLETVIELFEVMLSYFTNTVSFVRLGAFALSHAGMMSVVLLLSRQADGLNPIVLILGNIFVIALEGLVVGIQSLRLEFYEMFSRFFSGSGREFVSYRAGKQ